MRNDTARRVTVAVVVIATLAVVAWWRWPAADARSKPAAALARDALVVHAASALPLARPWRNGGAGTASGERAPPDPQAVRCANDRRRQIQSRRGQLPSPATAKEAIEHALLGTMLSSWSGSGPYRDPGARELQRARQRWPDNLDLAWFSFQHCAGASGCNQTQEWRHLASVDPDNAAVWMVAMSAATRDKDAVHFDQALQLAADAKFYDARRGTTFLYARPLLGELPLPESCLGPAAIAAMQAELGRAPTPADWADVAALGLEMAVAIPAFGALLPCREDPAPLTAMRRQNCMALLARVAAGDSLIEQSVGLSLLIPLVRNGPGSVELRERYRRLRWLQMQQPQAPIPEGYAARLQGQGEVALLRARAVSRGRWPPPADWLPPDARGRALILAGRRAPE